MDNLWLMVNSYPLVNIQKAIEHGTFIVDVPIKNANFSHSYVSLPEGREGVVNGKKNSYTVLGVNRDWIPRKVGQHS